jgi:hypothetical protein
VPWCDYTAFRHWKTKQLLCQCAPCKDPFSLMSLQPNDRDCPLERIKCTCSYIDTCQCPGLLVLSCYSGHSAWHHSRDVGHGVAAQGCSRWVCDDGIYANVPSVYRLDLDCKRSTEEYLRNQASEGGGWVATAFTTDDLHSSEAVYDGAALWIHQ